MTKKRISSLIVAVFSVMLSACVTQEFKSDNTPVVKNQANRNDMAATRISLGLGYLKMSNMTQAKKNLEKAKKFAPNMVQVYTAFAHYYETVGENKLAIQSFEKALSLNSDDADTLNNYGVYLCRQDELEAAEKKFLKAIAVPSYLLVAKSYENLSACFLQIDNFAKAEMYLHKAIMHSPSRAVTLFQMVRLQYAMGEFRQAKIFEQRFEKVTRRFTPQSLALAYKVYWQLGQRRTANNYGSMLVKMYPQSWETQQYLLNELEHIEADNLAKRYKLSQLGEVVTKSKKRVVKLSPKKTSSKTVLASKAVNSPGLANSKIESEKVMQVSIASSATINAALTMGSIAAVKARSAPKQSTVISVTAQKVPTNTNVDDKRLVVLVAPKADVLAIAEEEIRLENREKAHLAKKPSLIIKAQPKVKKSLATTSIKYQQSSGNSNKTQDIHVVTSGDTLYGISIKYNIKIKALRRWNNLTGNKKIRINDKLHLKTPKTVTK